MAVISATENSVTLAWDPESQMVGSVTYRVFLRHVLHDPKGSDATIWYTQIGTTTTLPTITITGLTPGLAKVNYVVATGAGRTSGYASILATTLSPQPPVNLRVTGLTPTSISLAWDHSPDPVPAASYEIWDWINNGVTSAVYGTDITNTTMTFNGLVPGSSHQWGVRAHDASGYVSAFDYGPTVVNPIPAPAVLTAVAARSTSTGFQFSASEGGSVLQTVLIQATTNPADPSSCAQIGSLLPTADPFTFTDPNVGQYPMRFYRILAP